MENDEGSPAIRWEKWREHFEAYLEWKNVVDHEEKYKTLMLFGGSDVRRVVSKLQVDGSHPMDNRYRAALQLLDEYFIPRVSRTFERQRFRQMIPEANEKLDKYVIRLRKQAANCGFENQTDNMIIDQIVSTAKDDKLKRKWLEKDYTLDEVQAMARAQESVQLQMHAWGENDTSNVVKDAVNQVQGGNPSSTFRNTKNRRMDKTDTLHANRCFRCDGRHSSNDPKCPAVSRRCKICREVGHFARCCRRSKSKQSHQSTPVQKQKRFVREVAEGDIDEQVDCPSTSSSFDLFHLGATKRFVSAKVGGVSLKMIIDTGAEEDILSENDWKMLKATGFEAYGIKKGSNKVFHAYGSKAPLVVLGEVKTDISFEGRNVDTTLYVIRGGKCSLLSADTAVKLGVIRFLSIVESEPFPRITGKP